MAYDLAVVGGGPGGYVAAIRASQLGKEVALIDDLERPGGICLNWGCIPTKVLLHQAEHYEFMTENAAEFGFEIPEVNVQWDTMIQRSRKAAETLGKGVQGLLKKNNVEYINDHARLVEPGHLECRDGESVEAENVLVATGAQPRELPGVQPNGERIITSKEAMILDQCPDRMIVLGAGAIGMEFAYFYHTFGTEIVVLEMMDRILPQEDPDVSEQLQKLYERRGMDIRTETAVSSAEQSNGTVTVETRDGETIEGDRALVAVGLKPNTEGLLAEDLNIRTDDNGWIDVKDDYRTSLPNMYAIGDVIGPPWLAHVASHEGIKMVEGAFTDQPYHPLDYDNIPAGTFCHPQVASVGHTETDARDEYDRVSVGSFPLRASGRAIAVGEKEGLVKLVFAGPYEQLVGAHIMGPNATEMITELALARKLECTPEEIFETVHPHPTLSESIMEAALDARDRVIHK